MRLSKAQVEALLANYDAHPVSALTIALRTVLDAPTLGWSELLERADISAVRRQRLLADEPSALDALAAELNETRTLELFRS
jgi:hypothetical protein